MVEMVTASFDLSKACDIGSIPVELLKNYEPELSYTLAELFDMCLRESCLPDCLKDSSVCMLGTVQKLKPTPPPPLPPISLLPVVSKVSEKLVKNRFLGHLEKYGLFSNFLYGFKSS